MRIIGKSSKVINKLLDYLVGIFLILTILFSTYSLYSSYMMFKGAFISDKLLAMKPEIDSQGDSISFADLKNINPDVKAWVTVDNTNIDYPVLQGETNLEYVNKNVYGDFAFEGAIFLDTRNSSDFSDEYSLLYGHHMENGSMFGDLELFLEKEFFEKNKSGKLISEDRIYNIHIFMVIKADGYDSYVFNPERVEEANDKINFLSYIDKKSIHSRDIDLKKEDKIIALSTCTSTETNGRTIVYGILKPEERR